VESIEDPAGLKLHDTPNQIDLTCGGTPLQSFPQQELLVGILRVGVPDHPERALREAMANALIPPRLPALGRNAFSMAAGSYRDQQSRRISRRRAARQSAGDGFTSPQSAARSRKLVLSWRDGQTLDWSSGAVEGSGSAKGFGMDQAKRYERAHIYERK
jgi:hypothetical protein